VSRHEDDRRLAELEALDRILAREPVGEEHLELAALVESVRAGAPRMSPEFETALAARFAPRQRRHMPRVGLRSLALASGGLVAAAVALTILLSGSVRNDLFGSGTHKQPAPAALAPRTHAPAVATPAIGSGSVAGATSSFGANAPAPTPSAGTAARLVQKASQLTLSAPPSQIQGVANHVVAATEQQGGVVESSNVDIQGSSSYAAFELRVPSGRLGQLIASLSALANVRSLNQSTQDLQDSYDRETALLSQHRGQLAALRKQLASAATETQAASLRSQIAAMQHRIAIERETIGRLRSEGANATLAVELVAGAASKHAHAGGTLGNAARDALHALEEILAIALVVLAIVLPFALTALAVWWAGASLRQRSRERALRAA
jgi:hypothetical protein